MMFRRCKFRSLLLSLSLTRTRITKAEKDKREETNNLAMLIDLYCHFDSIAVRKRKIQTERIYVVEHETQDVCLKGE